MVTDYLENCFTGPNLPATMLLILVLLYGVLVILGMLDIELFDIDFSGELDGDLFTSAGMWSLRILNIGQVPIMIWLSVFGLTWWVVSMMLWFSWDKPAFEPGTWDTLQLVVRNVVIGLVITKALTQPLVKIFVKSESYSPDMLLGKECVVSTYEATTQFGQARYQTDGAPLLLNVRTANGTLAKGDRAVIVDYDPAKRVYQITPAKHEVHE